MNLIDLVRDHTVLSTVVGSQAYGLSTDSSDVDRRGVYVAPTELFWGFVKPPSSVDGPEPERLSWEVEHFCALGLKANPTVLDVLGSDLVEVCTPLGEQLRALLPAMLSLRAVQSFRRATDQQLVRAASSMETTGDPAWKQVMHVVRLLQLCETLVRTGQLVLDASAHRDQLLAVRAGELPWPAVLDWVQRLRGQIDEAADHSPLPPLPDRAAVESWLVSVRRQSANRSATG